MSLPRQSEVEIPLLRAIADRGGEAVPRDIYDDVARQFPQLTADDLAARMDSGAMKWWNHVQWARQRLVQKGEIDGSVRGVWRITSSRMERLGLRGTSISPAGRIALTETTPTVVIEEPPQESMEAAHRELREALVTELLQTIVATSPGFFERLVVDLLVRLGYGGSRKDAGQAVGKSSDEGIDGIINEDRLGLGRIYVQAKRWEQGRTVGRPEIQKFAGALQGQRASKGVFITTATFTKEAWEFVDRIDSRIVMIDGRRLAELMIDAGVGVATVATYEVKRVDSDYFADE